MAATCRCHKVYSYASTIRPKQEELIGLRLAQDVIVGGSTGCLVWGAGFRLAEFTLGHPQLFEGNFWQTMSSTSNAMDVLLFINDQRPLNILCMHPGQRLRNDDG